MTREMWVRLCHDSDDIPCNRRCNSNRLKGSQSLIMARSYSSLTPMVMSFDVAKNQYSRTPMKDE